MKRELLVGVAIATILLMIMGTVRADWAGYHKNRIFVGTTLQWCEQKFGWDEATCLTWLSANGYGPYIYDKITMKWNEAWDLCNDHGNNDPTYCVGAWTNNEWNGNFPGGSGQNWHYKIIWVGSEGASSAYWRDGGYMIWGNYEVIMDQGMDPNVGVGHLIFAHATPNGYGVL